TPFNEFRSEWDRFFGGFPEEFRTGVRGTQPLWQPACEVNDRGDHYEISLEVPGVPRDKIKVELHEGDLVISGERSSEKTEEDKKSGTRYSERTYGQFERRFSVPQGTDLEKVEATYVDG